MSWIDRWTRWILPEDGFRARVHDGRWWWRWWTRGITWLWDRNGLNTPLRPVPVTGSAAVVKIEIPTRRSVRGWSGWQSL